METDCYNSLRRRFEQNQEDCAYTVLTLLPAATAAIIKEIAVESLTEEIRKLPKNTPGAPPSVAGTTDAGGGGADDVRSVKSFVSEGMDKGVLVEKVPTKTRAELWEEIKINSITRVLTIIYTTTLLTLFTHIQLNLLGRKNYLNSVASLAPSPPNAPKTPIQLIDTTKPPSKQSAPTSPEDALTNRQYLSFGFHLINHGWRPLRNQIAETVKKTIPQTAAASITFPEIHTIFKTLRSSLPTPPILLPYLLPAKSDEEQLLRDVGMTDDDAIPTKDCRKLLDETADLIESPLATTVCNAMLNSILDVLERDVATEVFKFDLSDAHEIPAGGAEKAVRLANVLAGLTKLAHVMGKVNDKKPPVPGMGGAGADLQGMLAGLGLGGMVDQLGLGGGGRGWRAEGQNRYVESVENVRELEGFSAVVYSEDFGRDD
jgi:peroxin-3